MWVKITDFLSKDVLIRGVKVPRFVITGLIAVVFMYVAVAGVVSIVTPWWLGSGDAPRHIDYALSVFHGDIPQFNDKLQFPVFNELANGAYGNQPAAVNPPLFYMIHALIIGPTFDSGHWQEGIAAGRALNIVIGVACIMSLAWAGWLLGGKRRALLAVAVPALAVLIRDFTLLNQNYAVDVLLILLSTLAFILSYKMLKNGVTKDYVIWLTLLSVLGMSTKATYIVFLFISLFSLVIAMYIHTKNNTKIPVIKGILIAGGIATVTVLVIGWYYYAQNYVHSGSWVSAASDNYGSTNREYKTLAMVLTSPQLWGMLYERFAANIEFSTAITSFALIGLATAFDKNKFRQLFSNKAIFITTGLMIMAVGGIFLTQVVHAIGYGGYYFRYFLPVVLPMSLALSYGLLELRWLRGQLITIAAVGMAVSTLATVSDSSAVKHQIPELVKGGDDIAKIFIASTHNGIPSAVPLILLGLLIFGSTLLSYALFKLSTINND